MSWNYRIFEDGKGKYKYYSIREVYYGGHEVMGFSTNPEPPIGDTPKELIKVLKMMLKDAKKSKRHVLKTDMKCIGWED